MNTIELTDDEIDNLIMDVAEKPTDEDLYDFAKAILIKTQEKATNTVMSEHCTCYKLGYSPLNDYAAVKQK
jgi:hypothetical protein